MPDGQPPALAAIACLMPFPIDNEGNRGPQDPGANFAHRLQDEPSCHTCTVSSSLAEAICLLLNDQATANTLAVCPL